MNQLSCLGIGCSPRVKGNTSILLERAMDGAEAAGAQCETIYLRSFRFSPCIACDGCHSSGQCVVDDDMQLIYEKLLTADRFVLAAPIFSLGINAMGKALIDRGQRFWASKYILNQAVAERPPGKERKGIFVSAAGTDLPSVFDCAVRCVKYYYKMLSIEYLGHNCFSKVDTKGAVFKRPEALEEVYRAGQVLVTS